jgi:hypothetical protein
MKLSACGRFCVLETLYVDREVFTALARWSASRGLRVQDAVQLAMAVFTEHMSEPRGEPPVVAASADALTSPFSGRPK